MSLISKLSVNKVVVVSNRDFAPGGEPKAPFNADMLKLAREVSEFTQTELAKRAGVTQALVSKLEHGLINEPGIESLEALSNALKFPVSFFFQRDRASGLPHFHFRKRAKMGAKVLAKISAVTNIRTMHISRLLASFEDEPTKPIPQWDLDDKGITPGEVAERMREYWMLPRGPIENVCEVIEAAGGIVVNSDFGTDHLDGISFRKEGLPPLFFMNRNVPGDRYRFSLAHELGHMIMHSVPGDDKEMEDEAHSFAANFLMPKAEIRPYLSKGKFGDLGRVKAYWKVSIKALIVRSHALDLITDYQYKSMNIRYNKVFKNGEPVPIEVERPTRLKRIVRYHQDTLGYSMEELADVLRINPNHAERLYGEKPSGPYLVISN